MRNPSPPCRNVGCNPEDEALDCNRHFYKAAKDLGVYPGFVHKDKDWSESVQHRLDQYAIRMLTQ